MAEAFEKREIVPRLQRSARPMAISRPVSDDEDRGAPAECRAPAP